jgi:hypothetical protein
VTLNYDGIIFVAAPAHALEKPDGIRLSSVQMHRLTMLSGSRGIA